MCFNPSSGRSPLQASNALLDRPVNLHSFNPSSGRSPLQAIVLDAADLSIDVSIPQAGGRLFRPEHRIGDCIAHRRFNPSSGRSPLQADISTLLQAMSMLSFNPSSGRSPLQASYSCVRRYLPAVSFNPSSGRSPLQAQYAQMIIASVVTWPTVSIPQAGGRLFRHMRCSSCRM